ncbi:Phosphatidylserine decarboxylase proenzyme 2 [Fusarium oxysporum f. sp. albedinis]|nr:Phosphatidylserine decarboxylase proenzyme 2 [Fusarium oxysporum f. sp. albedinis]
MYLALYVAIARIFPASLNSFPSLLVLTELRTQEEPTNGGEPASLQSGIIPPTPTTGHTSTDLALLRSPFEAVLRAEATIR